MVGAGAHREGHDNPADRTSHHRTKNTVSGVVHGATVQAGAIYGDVHFHPHPPRTVPHELPPPPVTFVGREDELAALDSRASMTTSGRCALIALGGVGGVGKTALGVSWLHRRSDRFHDGLLYVDLGATDAHRPMSASEALGRCLRSLSVPSEQVPAELSERTSLYRSLTAGRSLALLLDNVVSAAQVRPLLPASETSVVLVTSRLRLVGLALDGATFVDLQPLSNEDSNHLLAMLLGRDRVEAEPVAARQLSELCSGFPLALGVVGARLLAHPQWSLVEFAASLRDQRNRLSALSLADDVSVQAVLDACYRDLGSRAAQVYCQLSACPGEDFPVELVGAVHLDVVEAKAALTELVEANLVQEHQPNRYRYHDLLRAHADGLGMEDEQSRQETKRQAIGWYLDRAVEADLTVNPQRWRLGPLYASGKQPTHFNSAESALDWYEQERANLLLAVHEAYEHGWDELVWQLCEALWSFFLYRKHYPDWMAIHEIGIAAAQRCEHPLAESRLRCQLGFGHLDLEEYDLATEVCEPALVLAEAAGHRESISTALSQLAKAERGRGDLDAALSYFKRSLALVEETGNLRGIAIRLRRIGSILLDQRRIAEGIDHMQRSATLLEVLEDRRGRARTLTYLGKAYASADRVWEARAALHEALAVMRDSGSPSYQADIVYALAALAENDTDITTALKHLREAEALYRASGHPRHDEIHERIARLTSPQQATQDESA
ncbi:tetratricopeptide repeat protein [Saccharopolyspora elongata]|uniref:Tetratricopeptide repeat protein n=1 Tax=Saccharopolyspora elongata TaxID=2530387 RepID=A0A4R4XZR3_9PSEU|nr:tetratricopeptide repeat protein [Saccharopolyspora elongata]TDD37183.1 tetratricopeptide repeat protein [Saccharopolyspora elongata]